MELQTWSLLCAVRILITTALVYLVERHHESLLLKFDHPGRSPYSSCTDRHEGKCLYREKHRITLLQLNGTWPLHQMNIDGPAIYLSQNIEQKGVSIWCLRYSSVWGIALFCFDIRKMCSSFCVLLRHGFFHLFPPFSAFFCLFLLLPLLPPFMTIKSGKSQQKVAKGELKAMPPYPFASFFRVLK